VSRCRIFGAAARDSGPVGIVYLLHFTRAYEHARHYTGWTEDLLDRLDRHAVGSGARLMSVVSHAGIGFVPVRTCEGTRTTERAIKNAGGAVRYSPLCTPKPRNGHWGRWPPTSCPATTPHARWTGRASSSCPTSAIPPPCKEHP
jgi:predicted GIY-YIG superfamily endonuclease